MYNILHKHDQICSFVKFFSLVSPEERSSNFGDSIVFDMLNVASVFGMLNDVVNMVRLGHYWPKDVWSKRIWERALELDGCFWRVRVKCHRSLDLLDGICGGASYMPWWRVSDEDNRYMRECEIIVCLATHFSVLRNDDVRLKGLPLGARLLVCDQCDLADIDDARHLIMQCPELQHQRTVMMDEIAGIEGGFGQLMAKHVEGFSWDQMVTVWIIAAKHIASMYKVKVKSGIG